MVVRLLELGLGEPLMLDTGFNVLLMLTFLFILLLLIEQGIELESCPW